MGIQILGGNIMFDDMLEEKEEEKECEIVLEFDEDEDDDGCDGQCDTCTKEDSKDNEDEDDACDGCSGCIGMPILTSSIKDSLKETTQEEFITRVETISNLIGIQSENGNWNYDPYMHGMLNGMLLCFYSMVNSDHSLFINAPKEWLSEDYEGMKGAREQIDKLADYITRNFAAWIDDGGAGDVAIKIMEEYKERYLTVGKNEKEVK